ncbi:TIGR02679 family protein [Planococcus sp. ISL-110]|uniref:TIGR02679 family protein n=1 Tax=Planococcus sp. ISL-110 TaxID=2819167 RepID=UPI001BE8E2C0|nr:TIGR02679 family protein [Planococcus sp. ISL-110]MBT2571351.1 TIGR02679 family protein [Planococcus sp. ISL-110]
MTNKVDEAVGYFSNEGVYKKLFQQFREKIESFGRVGGTVKLESYSEKELEPVALFFGTSANALKKKKTISLSAFEKRLQQTKFEEVGLYELLEAYFKEPIQSKKSVKESIREQEQAKLAELSATHSSLAFYFDYLGQRNGDSHWIMRMLLTDEFGVAIKHLARANEEIPKSYERLPFFSQRLSGDPHTFDLTTANGKLLIHLLHFKLYGKGGLPSQTEAVNELLLNFHILRDDITNFVSFANLFGEQEGKFHPVWRAAAEAGSAVNMPLRELLKIDKAYPALGTDVYIVENSGVFSALLDLIPYAPLVCTHGQFKLAGLRLIDCLVASGSTLYYAGDFDPEGVSMAVRLLERHPEKIRLWCMDVGSYIDSLSPVELGTRLGKLNNINHSEVRGLVAEMNRVGKAGYQEALLEKMAEDLKK